MHLFIISSTVETRRCIINQSKIIFLTTIKMKLKFTLQQTMKAQRAAKDIALLFL